MPYSHYVPAPSTPDGAIPHSPSDSYPRQQPPLKPTGFIHAEYGMLIPVYHQEALDQYMTSTDKDGRTHTWMEAPPPPAGWTQQPGMQQQPQPAATHDWNAATSPAGMYPMMYPPHSSYLPAPSPYHLMPYPAPAFSPTHLPANTPPRHHTNQQYGPKAPLHTRVNNSNTHNGNNPYFPPVSYPVDSRAQNNNRRFSKSPATPDSAFVVQGNANANVNGSAVPMQYGNQPPPYTSEVPQGPHHYRPSAGGSHPNQDKVFPTQLMIPPSAWGPSSFEG